MLDRFVEEKEGHNALLKLNFIYVFVIFQVLLLAAYYVRIILLSCDGALRVWRRDRGAPDSSEPQECGNIPDNNSQYINDTLL